MVVRFPPISPPQRLIILEVGKPMSLLGKPSIFGNTHITAWVYTYVYNSPLNIISYDHIIIKLAVLMNSS